MPRDEHDVAVIGAGPAGLACAACLKREGVEPEVLERGQAVGTAWRTHYDRLHLHTDRRNSNLPGLPIPAEAGRYPSRDDVVAYLERYAAEHGIEPTFGAEVTRLSRPSGAWEVVHRRGSLVARNVVVATGFAGEPVRPEWPGEESFPGPIRHSADYRNGAPFAGQDVLVVGFGNSGGEIALDLAEHGATPELAVRSPVNILPRELVGLPILALAIPLSFLPPAVADTLSAPALRLAIGSYERLGLEPKAKGPMRQIEEDRRIPLIDVGTVELLRTGGAGVKPEVVGFDGPEVRFADGSASRYDAVIAATGYRPSFHHFLEGAERVTDEEGVPLVSGRPTALAGLYFCGFYLSPTGMLREIGIEARRIAAAIADGKREGGAKA